jgi:hypothetical protein
MCAVTSPFEEESDDECLDWLYRGICCHCSFVRAHVGTDLHKPYAPNGHDWNARRHDEFSTQGWLAIHFITGTVLYGGAFVVLVAVLRTDAYLGIGLLLGAIGWLMAMLAMMSMVGKGLFGMKAGVMAPSMSL